MTSIVHTVGKNKYVIGKKRSSFAVLRKKFHDEERGSAMRVLF